MSPWRRASMLAALLVALHATAAQAQRPHWLGFRFDLGADFPQGAADKVFQGGTRGEFTALISPERVYPMYFGFGVGLVAYGLQPGIADDDLWNLFGLHAAVGYTWRDKTVPLYLEARVIDRRLRPLDRRYWASLQGDDPPQERPYDQWEAVAVEGVVGLELPLHERLNADASIRAGSFGPGEAALADGTPLEVGGWTFGFQVGLLWFP